MALAKAQLIAITAVGATLSYLAVTSKFPLVDRYLAAGDAAIGFNWLSSFAWMKNHPAIDILLNLSYVSIVIQTEVLIVALSITSRFERLREFLWVFALSLLIVLSLSWILPAESAWVYFGVTDRVDAYHLADFTALRAGGMQEIDISKTGGIITFPSFHAAHALIMIYATRGIRILFPVFLVLNILMIVSTPVSGGHYFVDILAGLAVVPCAVMILRLGRRPIPAADMIVMTQ